MVAEQLGAYVCGLGGGTLLGVLLTLTALYHFGGPKKGNP